MNMNDHKEVQSVTVMDKIFCVFVAIISVIAGVFFIISQSDNKPIPRSQAMSYSGEFEEYEVSKNYCGIRFKDGEVFEVYPHTEKQTFRETMKSLEKGTKLYVLINPNNGYVAEIRTDTEELLNFEASQKAIDSYDNGYIIIGAVMCAAGPCLVIITVMLDVSFKKQKKQRALREQKRKGSENDPVLRRGKQIKRSRILLEAKKDGYNICYRRVRQVNELVINGMVYDEMKALIEYEHKLYAVVDGHKIEAGLDEESFSYIYFDDELVAHKKRNF